MAKTSTQSARVLKTVRPLFFGFIAALLTALAADAVVQPVGIRPGLNVPYSRLYYHRGPVMSEPNVYLIWYGNWNRTNGTDTAEGQQIVRDFLHALGGSPYFAINTTYSTSNATVTGNLMFAGETSDAYSRGKSLTSLSLLAVVTNSFVSNSLPKDTNGIYFVLASSDVYHTSGFCTRFCGLHKNAFVQGSDIRYAFVGNAARCLTKCAAQYQGQPERQSGRRWNGLDPRART